MSNLFSIVELNIKPQERDAYMDALRALISDSRTTGAIVSHKLHIAPHNPSKCVVTVRWASKDAMSDYQNGDLIKNFMNETAFCLADPSIYKTFTIESEQTLL